MHVEQKWDEEVAHIASTSVDQHGRVVIKNVRDFSYGDRAVVSTDWIPEVTINPGDVVRVWFVLGLFSRWHPIAHTFLTFECADGSAYSFSIEGRKKEGERYSIWRGLWSGYELAYTWGTERDFITRRVLYLDYPVRMYPVVLDAAGARGLFMTLVRETDEVNKAHRFYNVLTANCTNLLAKTANEMKPGEIPYDLSWNFPGFSDRFLMKIGLVKTAGSIAETMRNADLTLKREQVAAIAAEPYAQFGKALRELLAVRAP